MLYRLVLMPVFKHCILFQGLLIKEYLHCAGIKELL